MDLAVVAAAQDADPGEHARRLQRIFVDITDVGELRQIALGQRIDGDIAQSHQRPDRLEEFLPRHQLVRPEGVVLIAGDNAVLGGKVDNRVVRVGEGVFGGAGRDRAIPKAGENIRRYVAHFLSRDRCIHISVQNALGQEALRLHHFRRRPSPSRRDSSTTRRTPSGCTPPASRRRAAAPIIVSSLLRNLHIKLQPDRTMVGAGNFAVDRRGRNAVAQTVGDQKIVDAPADVLLPRAEAVAPPGICAGQLRIAKTKGVCKAARKQLREFPAFLVGKSRRSRGWISDSSGRFPDGRRSGRRRGSRVSARQASRDRRAARPPTPYDGRCASRPSCAFGV